MHPSSAITCGCLKVDAEAMDQASSSMPPSSSPTHPCSIASQSFHKEVEDLDEK